MNKSSVLECRMITNQASTDKKYIGQNIFEILLKELGMRRTRVLRKALDEQMTELPFVSYCGLSYRVWHVSFAPKTLSRNPYPESKTAQNVQCTAQVYSVF